MVEIIALENNCRTKKKPSLARRCITYDSVLASNMSLRVYPDHNADAKPPIANFGSRRESLTDPQIRDAMKEQNKNGNLEISP